MDRALKGLDSEELRILFNYVREWNTKPKLCYVSQFVLFRVFCIFPPTDIVQVLFLLFQVFRGFAHLIMHFLHIMMIND